jgi:membrane protease YdiL (CAAX protease family)
VIAAGCALLMARPILYEHSATATTVALLFGSLLVVGLLWPVRSSVTTSATNGVAVLAGGTAVFVVGRVLGHAPAIAPFSHRLIPLTILAAVAEEAFFRRLVYGTLLDEGGAVFAVAASTVLFALVHISIYGLWVLPLDLAAGAVLGWQRWASGSWKIPAVTHVIANLLMVV